MRNPDEILFFGAVRADIHTFARMAFLTLYPGKKFEPSWHIDAILHRLKDATADSKTRLILNIPPRSMKSFLISVVYPAFILGHHPNTSIMVVSYSDELAASLAGYFRRIVESRWYRGTFPEVRAVKNTENQFVTSQGGYRFATSVGGTLTGKGADLFIIDDPIKPEDAMSDRLRQRNNEWFSNTALSRLENKTTSSLILVMQRLHVNDLTGYVESYGFEKLAIPAIAVKDERYLIGDDRYHHRQAGEVLQPARESLEVLESFRAMMSTQAFSAQYQQAPDTPQGALFKREWLKVMPGKVRSGAHGLHWLSIDSAASTADTADYTAMTLGFSCLSDGVHYVRQVTRGRWDYETLLGRCLQFYRLVPDLVFLIERSSSGISLEMTLLKMGLSVRHHSPQDDKRARAARTFDIFSRKRVVFLEHPTRNNEWIKVVTNEIMSFPFGPHDDQVDSLVAGLTYAEPSIYPAWRIQHPELCNPRGFDEGE